MKWTAGIALATIMASSSVAMAEDDLFVFSANGPGAGRGAIGMGGRVFIFLPLYDVNYARGFTDDLDLVVNISTLGIITFADLGMRLRLLGSSDAGFALALKAVASPTIFLISFGEGAAGAVAFGATPGVVASFGSPRTQFSLGLDVPIFFGAAGFATVGGEGGTASGGDVTTTLRPSATIEFGVSPTVNMYIQAQGYIPIDVTGFVGPFLAVGAIW